MQIKLIFADYKIDYYFLAALFFWRTCPPVAGGLVRRLLAGLSTGCWRACPPFAGGL
ncbi:MAG: hypothetical protein AB1432_12000 [Bacteroidota bacterium]